MRCTWKEANCFLTEYYKPHKDTAFISFVQIYAHFYVKERFSASDGKLIERLTEIIGELNHPVVVFGTEVDEVVVAGIHGFVFHVYLIMQV